jgi:hypothetical protein
MYKIITLALLAVTPLTRAGDLPWYFNTTSFRNWATANHVSGLLLSDFGEEDRWQSNYAMSHVTRLEAMNHSVADYRVINGVFCYYRLDSSGYVSSLELMHVSILYADDLANNQNIHHAWDDAYAYDQAYPVNVSNNHFRRMMTQMASGKYMPEVQIEGEMQTYLRLGSAYCHLKAVCNDTVIENSLGERITDKQGVVYRENMLNHYDTELCMYYGCDFMLRKVVYFEKNVPVRINKYAYLPDCYDPISQQVQYAPVSDSIAVLSFEGVMNEHPCDRAPVEAAFRYPVYAFRQTLNSAVILDNIHLRDVFNVTELIRGAQLTRFGYGSIDLVDPEKKYIPLVENYRLSGKYLNGVRIIQSVSYSRRKPFSITGSYEPYAKESTWKGKAQWEHLETTQTLYKNGALKEVAYKRYDTLQQKWLRVGTEKYEWLLKPLEIRCCRI